MNPQTPDNEVARLQAETDRLYIVAQEASESAQRKTNEVARLRELLENATDLIADIMWDEVNAIDECEKWLRAYAPDRLNRLAPAPEEPVTGLCLICHEKQTTCSSGLCEECKMEEEPTTEDSSVVQPDPDHFVEANKMVHPEAARFKEEIQKLRELLETVACSLEFTGHKASADKIRADVEALNAPKQ